MLRTLLLSSAIALALPACGDRTAPESTMPATESTTAAPAQNALFTASTLPFQAPPFDKLKDADYQPAIEEGMQQHLAEIRTIADNPDAPTSENTIEAMERSGERVKQGVAVMRSYEYNTQFLYTDLEKVKPAMIAAATKDARNAAEQFAKDSGSKVGNIRSAQQGLFMPIPGPQRR